MATPLYFLPGTMCDQRLWQDLWPALDSNFELHHVDLPQEDCFDKIIEKLSRQLPDTPFHLIGFSLGGYVASLLACRFPERIKALLVLSNSPGALSQLERQQRQQTIQWVEKFGYKGLTSNRINQLLHQQHHDQPRLSEIITAMDRDGGKDKLLSQLKATTKRQPLSDPLGQLTCPVHYVYGEQDCLVDKPMLARLTASQPHIDAREISGAGHMLPLEAPARLAGYINRVLIDEYHDDAMQPVSNV